MAAAAMARRAKYCGGVSLSSRKKSSPHGRHNKPSLVLMVVPHMSQRVVIV